MTIRQICYYSSMPSIKPATILAIETSCDETSVAVLRCRGGIQNPQFTVLSNIVSSQVKLHAQYGGVVPNLAKREHIKNLPIVLNKALRKAGFLNSKIKNIDAIAVTHGPGLEPALWTRINFAKELSHTWSLPLIAVNHMEGHIFATHLKKSNIKNQK